MISEPHTDTLNRDPKQAEWIQAYYQIFRDLTEYVKQTYPSGILWNPKGVSADEALKSVGGSQAPAPSAGGPPPPPPPPPGPPPKFDIPDIPDHAKPKESGIGAVFNELNKGADVTKGLRKVDKSQMTHKNPSLRAGSTVPTRSDSASSVSSATRGKSPAPGKKPKPESMRTKKPPVKRLDGNKWLIVSITYLFSLDFDSFEYRKTSTVSQSQLRLRPKSLIPFSSVAVARPLLW